MPLSGLGFKPLSEIAGAFCIQARFRPDSFAETIRKGQTPVYRKERQANGTSNVTYGATGTQVTIDNSGDVLAAGKMTAANAVIAGSVAIGTTQAVVPLDIYSTAQIETPGTANGQQANINLVTKADVWTGINGTHRTLPPYGTDSQFTPLDVAAACATNTGNMNVQVTYTVF